MLHFDPPLRFSTDIEEVSETFQAVAEKEIEYRELKVNEVDVANDLLYTTLFIAKVFRNMKIENDQRKPEEIRNALRDFRPFTTSSKTYTIETLQLDASIASYLTALIATGNTKKFRKYDPESDNLRTYFFSDPEYNFLNRLSRLPNGTLYYLKSAYDLLNLNGK